MSRPTITKGSTGTAVKEWQRIVCVKDDGIFGRMTYLATKIWQTNHGLLSDGIVGPKTWAAAQVSPTIPPNAMNGVSFIRAKHYTAHIDPRKIDLIVIHVTQNLERPGTARALAIWAASDAMAKGKEVSWHFILDNKDIVQCVLENDIAWHSGEVNGYSIGIEHVGMSNQTIEEWHDDYSDSELLHSARLCAILCTKHGLPVYRPSLEEIRGKTARGICGHWDITKAFNVKGGHSDPGFNFPWNEYLHSISHIYESLKTPI